ncbi:MAG: zinc ribbon domain-containing protein [Sphaerobacter sp.]|nr:zinc ribbon domain-containing protein [Sphaerobacter sp.]
MYCAQCGTSSESGGDTCDVCGAPLTTGSGPACCPSCEAPISAYDRYCHACGATLMGPDAARYEPGPSFVDDSDLEVDPATLPPWLRDVLETIPPAGEAAAGPGELAPAAASAVPSTVNGGELPAWLREERPGGSPPGAPATSDAPSAGSGDADPGAGLSLLGDDDLPEWLRAFGDDAPSPGVAPAVEAGGGTAAATPTPDVPKVGRAWLERPRAVDPATVAAAREAFTPVGDEAEAAPVPPAVVAPTRPATTEAGPAPVAPLVDVAPAVPDAERRKRRVRILILLLAIAVLVLLLVVWLGEPR